MSDDDRDDESDDRDDIDRVAVGQRVKEARERIPGLTQDKLARRLGLANGQGVWRYEAEGKIPRGPRLLKLARELRVDVNWLLYGIDPPSRVVRDDGYFNEEMSAIVEQVLAENRHSDDDARDLRSLNALRGPAMTKGQIRSRLFEIQETRNAVDAPLDPDESPL